ncbi:UTRA domain-containing protein [Streptomyces sp. NPDC057743]|uniref:UTRA domain-containing protein n=1 Tax=Streptomyces sp. NPDC057743 TaxID=3346236 RepID=UPI00368C3FD1
MTTNGNGNGRRPTLLRRRGVQRLAREQWGEGRSIWAADIGDRELVVDQVSVTEAPAPARRSPKRTPAPVEADRLRLGAGTPVIVIVRTAFADGGRPVEVNEMILDSAAYVLEYDVEA